MFELSYNKASTFRGCPKKFYWHYVEGLVPVTRTPALSLGGILHEGFDLFYKGASDGEVYKHILEKFTEEVNKEEVADQEELILSKYTALGMWLNYPYKNLKEYDSIISEEEFNVPLGEGLNFIGKVDGRVFQNNRWWIRELKTTGLSLRQFEGRAHVSGQATGYVYGLTKKGYDIKGVMYEYIRKPILRKNVKENVEGFGHRIMADYKNRPNHYYNRCLSYRTPQDLSNFENDTLLLCHDIQEKITNGNFYRNVDQCWNFNSECPYSKICFAEKPDPLTLELYYTRKGGDK
jgi:hypothetical protein